MSLLMNHRRWATISSGVAPLLVLAAARLFAGPGPAAANAGSEVDPVMVVVPRPVLPVPAVGDATLGLAMSRELAQGFGRSPLISKAPPAPPTREEYDPAPIEAPQDEPTPPFRLTTIMGTAKGPVAVIDKQIRQIGSTVVPGWTVLDINSQDGTVTIAGPGERVVTLRLKPNM